jgi:hypothetical protein
MAAYATMGYHYDGIDRRTGHSVRKIRQFITDLDTWTRDQISQVPPVSADDEDSDLFGVIVDLDGVLTQISFQSPSLANMPKPDDNQGRFLLGAIKALAIDPELVLNLPYLLFPVLSEPLGRALGFL